MVQKADTSLQLIGEKPSHDSHKKARGAGKWEH